MYLYLRNYSSQDHENFKYIWIVHEKLLAFFEDHQINKQGTYSCVWNVKKKTDYKKKV